MNCNSSALLALLTVKQRTLLPIARLTYFLCFTWTVTTTNCNTLYHGRTDCRFRLGWQTPHINLYRSTEGQASIEQISKCRHTSFPQVIDLASSFRTRKCGFRGSVSMRTRISISILLRANWNNFFNMIFLTLLHSNRIITKMNNIILTSCISPRKIESIWRIFFFTLKCSSTEFLQALFTCKQNYFKESLFSTFVFHWPVLTYAQETTQY